VELSVMEYKDYYKIMGISREATPEEIKRSYRKLARKYHPDVSKEKNAEAKFKDLGEAYEVLKDEKKREAYDQLGQNWQAGQDFKPPPGWAHPHGNANTGGNMGGFDASDFFESLFGGGVGRRPGHHPNRPRAGEDLRGKIQVSLEEAFKGATKQLQIPFRQIDQSGRAQTLTRTLNVKIPAGVKPGQQIRLAGQGAAGLNGGANGNLFLEIEIQKHVLFDLVGNDVYCSLPVTPWEVALGATVMVPTLDKKVDLKIPPNSQGGQKLRLRGRGLPDATPGDQYVILKIIIPQPTTDDAKALYRKMAEEMPFNPREKLGV
jgi:curved DNA-binding protein